jgi:hypothetical protein
MGDGLLRCARRSANQVHDGVDGDGPRERLDQFLPLYQSPTDFQQPTQGLGRQAVEEFRQPPLEHGAICSLAFGQFPAELEEIADDHAIVGRIPM